MLIDGGMLAFVLLFSGASAISSSLTFTFSKQPTVFRKNAEVCRMCYGEYDCLTMDKTRCEYNVEAAAVLYDGERRESNNSALKTQVDSMLNNLMFQESIMEKYGECIPIVSSYSNCNKDNICSGCRTCDCTLEGKWDCSLVQHCRRDSMDIDHRVLVFVMEQLKSDRKSPRAKRNAYYAKSTSQPDNLEKIFNWFYEETTPFNKMAHLKESSSKTKRDSENAPTIDEVLNYIGFGTNDSSTDDTESPNHIDGPKSSKDIDEFLQILSLEEAKEAKLPALDAVTRVIVNFSNDNNSNNTVTLNLDNLTKKDTNEKLNNQVVLENDFNLMDSLGFIDLINVMKRDINQVNKTFDNTTVEAKIVPVNLDKPVIVKNVKDDVNNITIAVKSSKNDTKNMTYSERILRKDVFDAITILIKNKHKEIKQLSHIKESLIEFMRNYNFNSTIHYESKFHSNNINSTFKSEVKVNNYDNFRRVFSNNNADLLEKYTKKLKLDINEVIRDILGIRKYQKSKVLSNDLKLLLQAITYFLKKNKAMPEEKDSNAELIGKPQSSRRQFSPPIVDTSLNPVLTAVIRMLEIIDKDMPNSNALGPLSPKANKVFKRIVNRNYIDDFGFKVNSLHTNLTTDLNRIGLKWQELAANIVNSNAADRLHNMKLLYITLMNDITQLKDASALSNFFYTRRMSLVDEMEQKAIIHRISTDLNKVDNIVRHYKKENNVEKAKKTKQKLSLFKKIKGLWKTSKDDLIKVLHIRSRPHIVQEMERKKNEDEKTRSFLEVMQKWQENLDIMPTRSKRSIWEYTKLKNRMKNIIPHYLRGKLHPALSAKDMGVRKKTISYRMRPKNAAHPAPKVTIATAKPKAVRLNKTKQNNTKH